MLRGWDGEGRHTSVTRDQRSHQLCSGAVPGPHQRWSKSWQLGLKGSCKHCRGWLCFADSHKKKCFSIGVRVTRGTRGPSQPAQSRGGAQHGTSSLPQPDPDEFAGAGAAPVPATSLTQSHGASFAAVGSKRCSRKNSGLMSASAAMERQGLRVN